LTLSWAASRGLESLVFEVAPTDATTWTASIGVLVCTVLVACAIPIRRAVKYDAAHLLRV
jgi:ABC-type antimicrobial peptide transport system permease subunit